MSNRRSLNGALLICCILALSASAAMTQSAGPHPLPMPPQIAAPNDLPYPGTIRLTVDATDIDRRIFNIRETIPVRSGEPITLLYPQWLPGNHSPSGRVDRLAGLMIRAQGRRLEWTRDTLDVFAFHVPVPTGVASLDVEFQIMSPVASNEGRIVMTPDMLSLQWIAVALYPAGYFARQITVAPSVRLPAGWQVTTALEPTSTDSGEITFKPVSFDTLADSPILAGRYFKRFDLDPHGAVPVHLDVVADRSELLDVK